MVPSLSRSRITALRILHESPCYGARLARMLGVSRSTASSHLHFLWSQGLVAVADGGAERPWRIYRATEDGRALLRSLRLIDPRGGSE